MSRAAPILQIDQLQKSFAGLKVTDHVSLDILPGEIHSVIGPNGAGKSTLVSQVSGLLASDGGSILLGGQNVTTWPAARRAQAGIARTFQITCVFRDFTALENVLLAYQCAHRGHAFRFWQPARGDSAAVSHARQCLVKVGLGAATDVKASSLAGGQQRAMEIAMAIASNPQILLLDEPMAGMGSDDTDRLMDLLQGLRSSYAVLLVEHDMDVVFRLSNRISVLVRGQLIATGSAQEIRKDAGVRAAYLGEEVHAEH